jgi:hypothetical protein
MALPDFSAGEILTAADLDAAFANLFTYGAWPTYTPSFNQGAAVTKTVSRGSYFKAGRLTVAAFYLIATGAGTATTVITAGLPVAAAFGAGAQGHGYFYDASTATYFPCSLDLATNLTVRGMYAGTGFLGATGSSFTGAIAAGDVFTGTVTYESAT